MKWSEFKEAVETELEGKDPEIDWIDVEGTLSPHELDIGVIEIRNEEVTYTLRVD